MTTEDYNVEVDLILQDYVIHLDRDRMMVMCQELSEECGLEDTEILEDVDLLYVEQYGDLYETA